MVGEKKLPNIVGGSFDPTKVSFTPKWFLGLVLAVIIVLGGVGIGTWGYAKIKELMPGMGAGDPFA